MLVQLLALATFVAVFALAAIRNVNIGLVMFPFAAAVGLGLADMALEDVIGGFPLSILVLLVGVTYFFGIAHSNGTIEWLIDAVISRVGGRDGLFPLVFFLLTAAISAMGAPLGGLVMAPVGMTVAARRGLDPMLMALAMGTGLSAGAFAPTSLFGIITWGTADSAGIDLNPMLLFGLALAMNLVLLAVAHLMFGRRPRPVTEEPAVAGPTGGSGTGREIGGYGQSSLQLKTQATAVREAVTDGTVAPPTTLQVVTLAAMAALVISVVVIAVTGGEPDIGVLGFALGALLAVIDPAAGKRAMTRIDWGSVLLVGGIITYVGVLKEMGVLDMLGESAAALGTPILAAFLLCVVAGLISAFASTTGMLAALVPLSLPLISEGGVPGWALICAIGVCASIVDVSPFSTVGATYVATAEAEDRPRLTSLLTRWGLAMVAVGPIALTLLLILPGKVIA
ncbi:MAG: C4-dicarboxylate ABC transporter [Kytococcus sp.]|nr:C4-dicarboxylate ABC transporter [Kytococcus sp.]